MWRVEDTDGRTIKRESHVESITLYIYTHSLYTQRRQDETHTHTHKGRSIWWWWLYTLNDWAERGAGGGVSITFNSLYNNKSLKKGRRKGGRLQRDD